MKVKAQELLRRGNTHPAPDDLAGDCVPAAFPEGRTGGGASRAHTRSASAATRTLRCILGLKEVQDATPLNSHFTQPFVSQTTPSFSPVGRPHCDHLTGTAFRDPPAAPHTAHAADGAQKGRGQRRVSCVSAAMMDA